MINLFKNTNIYGNTARYDQECLTISVLKDNQYREPNIKIEDTFSYFYGYYSRVSPFTYVTWQALSKLLNAPIKFETYQTSSPDEYLERDFNAYINKTITDPNFNVSFVAIASSNMDRAIIKRQRTSIEPINVHLDDNIQKKTNGAILGISINETKNHALIYIDKKKSIDPWYQIFTTAILFRLFRLKDNIEETEAYKLLTKLTSYYAERKSTIEDPECTQLKALIIEYAKDLVEYNYDTNNTFKTMLRKLREKRCVELQNDVQAARHQLDYALENLYVAQRIFDSQNELLTAAMTIPNTDLENQLNEMNDLLARSPRIIQSGTIDYSIWMTIHQPLYINDKTEWQRISENVVKDELLLKLLNETFIDEKYELWTECSVKLDIDKGSISKYGDNTRMKTEHAIPHPHISAFGCFGQHSKFIGDFIHENNYVGAIEQVIEAASGLNWSDNPVISRLIYNLLNIYPTKKCFKYNNTWFALSDYKQGGIDETTNELKTDIDNIPIG